MGDRNIVRDVYEYARTDLARRFKSTAGSQPRVPDDVLEPAMESLTRDGYVVFDQVLGPELVRELGSDLLPRLPDLRGRNNFEGFATRRLYGVIEKTYVCDPLLEHPLVLGLLDRVLEPNYLLSQVQAIQILPGEVEQPIHHDDAFYPWPRPRRALGAAAIWAIDAFTGENGATVVLPGSHTWADRSPDERDLGRLEAIAMPAGSLLFLVGTLWHAGGANRSTSPRLAVAAQYCAPWCRQQENFTLSVPRERVRRSSEHLQRLLGYSIHPPFMGFVNGMHPKRLLEPGGEG